MNDLETLLLASVAIAKLKAENERLREENASLRRVLEGDAEFDMSGDDLPKGETIAFFKRQIG
jgi:hypothetical protein